MNNGRSRRAYSLIEAMVSVALVAVGVTAVLGGFAKLTNSQIEANDTELMQRLAVDKYDELIATGSLQTQALNGDFSDRGNDRFLWDASIETTTTDTLSSLTVTVTPRQDSTGNSKFTVNGLIYVPPQTTTTPGTGAGQ